MMSKSNDVASDDVQVASNFIHNIIEKDLENQKYQNNKVHTRFPPEPNGYLHIGHAKAITINFSTAKKYNGKCNLRFDDTNPFKEDTEYVESIKEDIEWLGFKWDNLYFASDYFGKMHEYAVKLINDGKAYVCDLTADEIREYRGDFNTPGKNSPYRDRSVDENLDLFEKMKNGELAEGTKVLRAKIDMSSPNINMRDPVIYRIQFSHHHNTGDKWCIYPMYDYAHPIEDAIEGITHSLCSLEFEDHRPLYDWVVNEIGVWDEVPQQIEFARLELTNTLMSKRYIKELVDSGNLMGWNDPRLHTLSGLRRRGYTPESIVNFINSIGVSKSNSVVDIQMLEYSIREDLKLKALRTMAVIDPLKVVITNYPEGEIEYLDIENNPENIELGNRKIPFSREIYIEKEDFIEVPPSKYKRLFPGAEVRLKSAYFIKCNEVIKDENDEVVELRCTYDVETKSGSGFTDRKVKGTIHWVEATTAVDGEIRLFDHLMLPKNPDDIRSELEFNKDNMEILQNAKFESDFKDVKKGEKFQFFRHGYFSVDPVDTRDGKLVINRVVSLKDSFNKKK